MEEEKMKSNEEQAKRDNKIRLFELAFACYIYPNITDNDKNYKEFLGATKPSFDMQKPEHRTRLLVFLNKFGCRQFNKDFHKHASPTLKSWYEKYGHLLPEPDKELKDFSESDFDKAKDAYEGLLNTVKASPTKGAGHTGTAKILFAIRKNAFPPWDGPIRDKYGDSPEQYREFLEDTKHQLLQLGRECEGYGIELSKLPEKLGRPLSSLVKLIDEYNWITITKKCPLPMKKLEEWYCWAE